jgi:hypothetical protein
VDREEAARFSFLMVLPPILGATALEVLDLMDPTIAADTPVSVAALVLAALGRRVHDVHHEGVVLVGGGCHEKAIGVIDILHEPSPSGTEAASRSSSQGLQDTFMVTKGAVDALGQKA